MLLYLYWTGHSDCFLVLYWDCIVDVLFSPDADLILTWDLNFYKCVPRLFCPWGELDKRKH